MNHPLTPPPYAPLARYSPSVPPLFQGGMPEAHAQYINALKLGGGIAGVGGAGGVVGDHITEDDNGTLLLNPMTAAFGLGGLGAGSGALIGASSVPTPQIVIEDKDGSIRKEIIRRAKDAGNKKPGTGPDEYARLNRGYRDGSIRRGRALLGTTAGATVGAGAALLHSLLDDLGQGY